ncbi:hypothetical protein ACQEVG_34140 [Streptomyces sp. CA-135486]|uniref:hypothetical protein n=1 Tax=Streptomyces sp. CA-135486 TaxID=3240049 RepID=UPI003D91AE3E
MERAVVELRAHPDLPDDVRSELTAPPVRETQAIIAELLELYGAMAARFARDTVNIGVSGRARVGKSTLLQSISGLTDTQIPTGSGLPVTAVRSRIHHTRGVEQAVLRLHTPASFLDEVVRAYHAEIGIAGMPVTLSEFQRWHYGEPQKDWPHHRVSVLRRLREMQDALWSFETELSGGERVVSLDELRPYVAYPTNEQVESGAKCPRPYLAVRDVRIECGFPHGEVGRLGIVDLPGLGENAVDAERHHLAGLRHEVDLILLVKRPVEGMAYWGAEDANALNLLDEVRGFIRQRGDFVHLVLNVGEPDRALAPALRDDIRRQVNDGEDGRYFTVLETDAVNAHKVGEELLHPLLGKLAATLPAMDADILAGTARRAAEVRETVADALRQTRRALGRARSRTAAPAEDLEFRVQQLLRDLATELAALRAELYEQAYAEQEDPDYVAAVDAAHRHLREWLADGLGTEPAADAPGEDRETARERWCEDALRTMRVDRASGPFASDEFNRIRVEVSRRFSGVNDYFGRCVQQLWERVAAVLADHTGSLLDGVQGVEALHTLADLARTAAEPCPTLHEAVTDLIDLRLEYRTQLHPRVRRELERLSFQVSDPLTGEPHDQITVTVDRAGARELFGFIGERAEQAAHRTRQALLRESMTPALVLLSAVEQFDDMLIRSANAERDLRRLARSYRNELWPGVYEGLDSGHARFARVESACAAVQEALDDGTGQQGQRDGVGVR